MKTKRKKNAKKIPSKARGSATDNKRSATTLAEVVAE